MPMKQAIAVALAEARGKGLIPRRAKPRSQYMKALDRSLAQKKRRKRSRGKSFLDVSMSDLT